MMTAYFGLLVQPNQTDEEQQANSEASAEIQAEHPQKATADS